MITASSQCNVALDHIGLGAAEIDLHHDWRKVNTQLVDWLGYSTEEFISLPFERVFELAEPEREAHV